MTTGHWYDSDAFASGLVKYGEDGNDGSNCFEWCIDTMAKNDDPATCATRLAMLAGAEMRCGFQRASVGGAGRCALFVAKNIEDYAYDFSPSTVAGSVISATTADCYISLEDIDSCKIDPEIACEFSDVTIEEARDVCAEV